MLGTLYTFTISDPVLGIERLHALRCLSDDHALQERSRLPGVTRITEGRRVVWPSRPRLVPLADDQDDMA